MATSSDREGQTSVLAEWTAGVAGEMVRLCHLDKSPMLTGHCFEEKSVFLSSVPLK